MRAIRTDMVGSPRAGPAPLEAIDAATQWLCVAQDSSATGDGGVARHYDVRRGWAPSYPETTGYIVPTFLDLARRMAREDLRARALRMLDWLSGIQLESGAFQGGVANQKPRVPVTFNTGQILLGLARGAEDFGVKHRTVMRRAAEWLVTTQDPDGAWRRFGTPFAVPGEKAYETHVAWGLLEADRIDPGHSFGEAALRNVRWAITKQQSNGWVGDCCLTDPSRPLTHTLGYFLRGVLEAYRSAGDADLLGAAMRTGCGLLTAQRPDGSLPGRLRADWSAATTSSCLTGNVQIAHCWLLLFRETGDPRFWSAATAANGFVRRTIRVEGPPEHRGAVRGSFPIWGDYAPFEYVNWAAKFFIDSQLLELESQVGD